MLLLLNCLFAVPWAFYALINLEPHKSELTRISLASTPDAPYLVFYFTGEGARAFLYASALWPGQALGKAHSLDRAASVGTTHQQTGAWSLGRQ